MSVSVSLMSARYRSTPSTEYWLTYRPILDRHANQHSADISIVYRQVLHLGRVSVACIDWQLDWYVGWLSADPLNSYGKYNCWCISVNWLWYNGWLSVVVVYFSLFFWLIYCCLKCQSCPPPLPNRVQKNSVSHFCLCEDRAWQGSAQTLGNFKVVNNLQLGNNFGGAFQSKWRYNIDKVLV